MRALLAFLVLSVSCFAQQTGRVEGRVLSVTGEPVAKVTVRITGASSPGQPALNYVEVTSSDGRFTVENIAPGRYIANAQRPGYTASRNSEGLMVANFEVAAGQTKTGIEIRLTPLAVVTGIVTDADGDPVPNPQVRLVRYTFSQGRMMVNTSSPTTNGDDRGVFRLLNVQPGRYYLLASGGAVPPTLNEIRGRSAQEVNLPTYYPGSQDTRGAVAITVGSSEIGNLNVRLRRGGTYSIRGTFVDTSGAVVAGQITVFQKGGDSPPQGMTTQMRDVGTFQIAGLTPGDYTIVVRSSPARPAPTPGQNPNPAPATNALSARLDVSVGSANLENITIRLNPGAELTGRVTIEGGVDLSPFMASLPLNIPRPVAQAGVGVTTGVPQALVPRMPSVSLPALEGPAAQVNGTVSTDGTFRITNIPPLKRVLQVSPLPPNAYVKSVRFGGQDITRAPLDLSSGAGGILEIVIATKGAEVTSAAPSSGALVTIWPRVPNPGSPTGDIRNSGGAATFKAQGLAPGDYYVAAWDTSNADYLRIPDFLNRFSSVATKVTVQEGESITVEAKMISRDAIEKEIAQFLVR